MSKEITPCAAVSSAASALIDPADGATRTDAGLKDSIADWLDVIQHSASSFWLPSPSSSTPFQLTFTAMLSYTAIARTTSRLAVLAPTSARMLRTATPRMLHTSTAAALRASPATALRATVPAKAEVDSATTATPENAHPHPRVWIDTDLTTTVSLLLSQAPKKDDVPAAIQEMWKTQRLDSQNVLFAFYSDESEAYKDTLLPAMQELAEDDALDTSLITIDVGKTPKMGESFGIASLPTVIGLFNGMPIRQSAYSNPPLQVLTLKQSKAYPPTPSPSSANSLPISARSLSLTRRRLSSTRQSRLKKPRQPKSPRTPRSRHDTPAGRK